MTPLVDVPKDAILNQGDIIDGCPIVEPAPTLQPATVETVRTRAIVLTQSCDLVNSKTTRVLVAVVHDADVLVSVGALKASQIRDQIRRGAMYGWYFLPSSEELGLPELIVDLRDIHTIPRSVLEQLIANGNRKARLITPFREHLAQHFAVTYMRIALPEPYDTKA